MFQNVILKANGLGVSQLNLEKQLRLLNPLKIFPLHLRLFRRYCLFLYNFIRNGKAVLWPIGTGLTRPGNLNKIKILLKFKKLKVLKKNRGKNFDILQL